MKTIVFVLAISFGGYGFAAEPPAKQPTPLSTARAAKLKKELKFFDLSLVFHAGRQDKPYYRLALSVPQLNPAKDTPFYLLAQISEPQAARLIDHLAVEGFLDNAKDLMIICPGPRTKSSYTLMAKTDRSILESDLGWGLPMLKRLEGLRKVLDGDAAKKMDVLLGRLAGHRKEWEEQEVKAKVAAAKKEYARYVHVAVIDPKQADAVGKLLKDHGIPSIIEGSVAYGISVPPEKKEKAVELLKADAAKRGYWCKTSTIAADNPVRLVGKLAKIDGKTLAIVSSTDDGYQKTIVTCNDATKVRRDADNATLKFADLKIGQTVRVYYTKSDNIATLVNIAKPGSK